MLQTQSWRSLASAGDAEHLNHCLMHVTCCQRTQGVIPKLEKPCPGRSSMSSPDASKLGFLSNTEHHRIWCHQAGL